MKPRLRDRPLTTRPRVIGNRCGQFYVERTTPWGPAVVLKQTFPEAITLACQWALEQPLEIP